MIGAAKSQRKETGAMAQRNIITAGPGWYVLRLTGSDRSGSYGIDREPIVGCSRAWRPTS